MRNERKQHTLQPSALVNKAFLRLIDTRGVQWTDPAHFYALAAQIMRRILVNRAKR
jgi:RNA polymerase sigma-70 factor, ECF subfamily